MSDPRGSADHLDANYRRARGPRDFGSSQALSTVVHASGCAPPLLQCCTELPCGLRAARCRWPLRPEANARCRLPPLLLSLTCPALSADVRWHPLVSVAVVTQLAVTSGGMVALRENPGGCGWSRAGVAAAFGLGEAIRCGRSVAEGGQGIDD